MTDRSCGVPEERWIDWYGKRLPPETVRALERHLETCSECRRVCKQWGEWLAVSGETESDVKDAVGLGHAGETAASIGDRMGLAGETELSANSDRFMPSDRVRRSLRFAAWRRGWKTRLSRRPVWVAGGAVAMFVLLAGLVWAGLPTGSSSEAGTAALEPIEYARLHEPQGAELMALPDTKVYSIVPVYSPGLPESGGKKAVTVWVNGRTDEIFVLLEGLLPAESRDVQAWGEIRQDFTNLGLLEFHQAQGHLYSHFLNLPDVREVAFTIEPKGGSQHPTAPSTARVRLAMGEKVE